MIGTLIGGTVALVFPLFASYRALVSNDISLIRPWLMYWVVFASFEFAESVFRPVLSLLPFYGLFRLGVLFWLVLPQTQGAVKIYQTQIEPWLSNRDQAIDKAIADAVEFVRQSPLGNLLALLGISLPKPPGPGGSVSGAAASGQGRPTSFVDSVMGSFRLPTSVDASIAAYIPSILYNQQPSNSQPGAPSSDYTSALRNRLLGLVKSLDTPDSANANTTTSSNTTAHSPLNSTTFLSSRETDEYDFVEAPKNTPSPAPGETEIEREIEEKLRNQGQSSGTHSTEARRRWF